MLLSAYLLFSRACLFSEVVFPEAAADGGGAVEVKVRTVGSCGDGCLYGMFFSCTVLLSKCFTNLIGIPRGRLPAVCLMVRVSNLVHGEN